MAYRKFKLINSKNEVWEFTNKEVKSFLNSPSGLGYTSSLSVTRYGEKANVLLEETSFPNPSGEVIFYDTSNEDRYQKYYNLCRFLTYTPLKLIYTLPFSTPVDYELDCYVTSISKTESTTNKLLNCSINFQGISFWKGETITSRFSTGIEIELTNNGDFPVGFEITITETDMQEAQIILKQNNEIYGIAKFGSREEREDYWDKIYINSNDGEQNVIIENDGALLPNPLSYQDISVSNGAIYVTFLKLARGTSVMEVILEASGIAEVKYTEIFRSV